MTTKILYATMTGHSRKVANAIGNTLKLEVCNLATSPVLGDCDLLYIVSGIYGGESKTELLELARSLDPERVKRVSLIWTTTRGVPQGSLRKTLEEAGVTVLPDEHQGAGGFLLAKMFRPNKADTEAAVKFAEQVYKSR